MKTKELSIAIGITVLAVASGCRREPLATPVTDPEPLVIRYIDDSLRGAFNASMLSMNNCLQFPSPIDDPQSTGAPQTEVVQSGNQTWSCQVQPMQFGPGFSEASLFSPSDVVWVGAFLRGGSLSDGSWTPLTYAGRNPVTLTTSLNTGGGETSIVMDAPSLSQYNQAHNSIIQGAVVGGSASTILMEMNQVNSEMEVRRRLGYGAGANFGLWGGSIAGAYEWNSVQTMNRFMVRLVQNYYTLSLDVPSQPDGWFGTEHLPDHTQMAMENHCPVYVSSITYGRIVYITIESSSSQQAVANAINASWNAFGAGGDFDLQSSQFNALENYSYRIFAIGGAMGGGLPTLQNGQIGNFINASAVFDPSSSPGAPIAFTVRRLSDNSIVKFVTISDYTVRTCQLQGTLTTATVQNGSWREYCPILEAGDNEFAGNGPEVSGTFQLGVSSDGKRAEVTVDVLFNETLPDTHPDDSRARVSVVSTLYTAPFGKRIATINANNLFNWGGYIDTDHTPDLFTITSDFIEQIESNGDTGGQDLPCGPQDRSYLKVKYKPFQVTLVDE